MATSNLLTGNIGNPSANEAIFLQVIVTGICSSGDQAGAAETFVIHGAFQSDGSNWKLVAQAVVSENKDPRMKHDYAYFVDSNGSTGQLYVVSTNDFTMTYQTGWTEQGVGF